MSKEDIQERINLIDERLAYHKQRLEEIKEVTRK